jgi:hypothetical protein
VDAIFVYAFPRKKRPFCTYSVDDCLSIFKYGCTTHGGFAIGLERLTQKVLGLANVKEACLFPRACRRCGRRGYLGKDQTALAGRQCELDTSWADGNLSGLTTYQTLPTPWPASSPRFLSRTK